MSSDLPWLARRATVNLAPSAVRKAGAGLDLAVAVGLLVAAGAVAPEAVAGLAFLGELGLDGTVRPVTGMVPLVDALEAPAVVVAPASAAVVVAPASAAEAAVVGRH